MSEYISPAQARDKLRLTPEITRRYLYDTRFHSIVQHLVHATTAEQVLCILTLLSEDQKEIIRTTYLHGYARGATDEDYGRFDPVTATDEYMDALPTRSATIFSAARALDNAFAKKGEEKE